MSIDILIHHVFDSTGVAALHADATITHSPREGFDNEKLLELETDLSIFVTKRLNAAIKRGGAVK